jgi:hypothetical protein
MIELSKPIKMELTGLLNDRFTLTIKDVLDLKGWVR